MYPDTPSHDVGAPLDIYSYEPVYPDTPGHDTGAPLDIYTYEPLYPDTPVHDTGSPLNIYAYEPVYPDTPGHDTGAPIDIYKYEPIYNETPVNNLNIYEQKPINIDIPVNNLNIYEQKPINISMDTIAPLDIYTNKENITTNITKGKSIYDIKQDDIKPFTGKINNIYDNDVTHPDTPLHTINGVPKSIYGINTANINEVVTKSLNIYDSQSKDATEVAKLESTLSIYDSKKETKDIKGGGNSLNIYGK